MFHEMGHEWWGNYLSVADWADFWIHEGFDTYAEALFVEEKFGKIAARTFVNNRYKKNIKNEQAVVPGRNTSTGYKTDNDIYYKGAHILHTLRYLIGNEILRESLKEYMQMPKEFPHNQTSTKEFISLIQKNSGEDIQWFFDQYLYNHILPTLMVEEEIINNKKFVEFWWKEEGFKMPIEIRFQSFDGERNRKLILNNSPNRIAIPVKSDLNIDPNNWVLYQLKKESK
jgi:aminopeptidase N